MPRIKKKPTIPAPDRADDVVECVGTILTSAGRYILRGDRLRRDDPAVLELPDQFRYPTRPLKEM
jgi:hypothetical protein